MSGLELKIDLEFAEGGCGGLGVGMGADKGWVKLKERTKIRKDNSGIFFSTRGVWVGIRRQTGDSNF